MKAGSAIARGEDEQPVSRSRVVGMADGQFAYSDRDCIANGMDASRRWPIAGVGWRDRDGVFCQLDDEADHLLRSLLAQSIEGGAENVRSRPMMKEGLGEEGRLHRCFRQKDTACARKEHPPL
jgi:hypothetical protein